MIKGKDLIKILSEHDKQGQVQVETCPCFFQTKDRVIVSILNYDNVSCENLHNFKSLLKLIY